MIPKGTYNLYTRNKSTMQKKSTKKDINHAKKSTKKDINHAKKSIKESMKLNEAS